MPRDVWSDPLRRQFQLNATKPSRFINKIPGHTLKLRTFLTGTLRRCLLSA